MDLLGNYEYLQLTAYTVILSTKVFSAVYLASIYLHLYIILSTLPDYYLGQGNLASAYVWYLVPSHFSAEHRFLLCDRFLAKPYKNHEMKIPKWK